MNTDAYTQFKLAFLDQVELKGYDTAFIEGFFKRAEDEYSRWDQLIATSYNGDPLLCKQAFAQAVYALDSQSGEKRAEGGAMGPEILGLLDQLGGGIGGLFGQQGGSGLGGAVAGGGGGMLIGLLLSQLFDIPLPMAMMLGALGGGALGFGAAGTNAGREGVFGVKPPGDAAKAAPGTGVGPGPGVGGMRQREGLDQIAAAPPQGQDQGQPALFSGRSAAPPSPAAAGVAQGQAVSNAAASGAPAQPPPVGPAGAPPTNPVVPPAQPAPGAGPMPSPQPGGMPNVQPPGANAFSPQGGGTTPVIKPPERK